jgi:hypothetical protein
MRRARSNSANRSSCGAVPAPPVPEVSGNTFHALHRDVCDGSFSVSAGRDYKRSGVTCEVSCLPKGCRDTSCSLDASASKLNTSGTACLTRCVNTKPPRPPPTIRRFHSCGTLDQERPTELASAEYSRVQRCDRGHSPRHEPESPRPPCTKALPEKRIQVPAAPSISPEPPLSVVATNLVAQRILSSQQVDELRGWSQEGSGRRGSPRTFVQQASARASAATLATTSALPGKQSLSRMLAKRAARAGARTYRDPPESSGYQAKTTSVQQDQAALHATLAHFAVGDGGCARSVSPPPALMRLLARSQSQIGAQAVFGGA